MSIRKNAMNYLLPYFLSLTWKFDNPCCHNRKKKKYMFLFFYSDPVMVSKTKGADKDDLLTVEDGRDGENTRSMVL